MLLHWTQSIGTDLFYPIHITSALLYLLILIVVFTVTKRWLFIDGRLPGPPVIPILGNLYVIFFNPKNFIAVLTKISQFYGSVYSFRMGVVPAIVVCGYDSVKEVLVTRSHLFSERPLLGYMKEHPEELGIFFQNGERWRYLRKLTLKTIHDLDTAKSQNIRRYIKEEMDHMVQYLVAKNGQAFDPLEILPLVSANIMCSIMLNRRFDYTDKRLKELMKDIDRIFEIEGFGQMEYFIPFIRHLKHFGIGTSHMKEIVTIRRRIKKFILMQEYPNYPDMEGQREVKCLADGFRNRVEVDADSAIAVCILDIIQASTSVTKATFNWILFYVAKFPAIFAHCRKELDQEFEDGPVDPMVHPKRLPYVYATLLEVLRISSAIPTAAPHMVSEDTTINGYPVEKGTLVLVNLHSVHHEKNFWGDPEVFRPSRFLDKEGNVILVDRLFSFGAGPRGCLGKEIAKKMLFSYLITILTKFNFEFSSENPYPSVKGIHRITYEPMPYKIVALPKQ